MDQTTNTILQTIFTEYGFIAIILVCVGMYFKSFIDSVRSESKEREEKLMAQNEQRELRFIDTINNITQDVSNRMDNIESDIGEIKAAVAPKA